MSCYYLYELFGNVVNPCGIVSGLRVLFTATTIRLDSPYLRRFVASHINGK